MSTEAGKRTIDENTECASHQERQVKALEKIATTMPFIMGFLALIAGILLAK